MPCSWETLRQRFSHSTLVRHHHDALASAKGYSRWLAQAERRPQIGYRDAARNSVCGIEREDDGRRRCSLLRSGKWRRGKTPLRRYLLSHRNWGHWGRPAGQIGAAVSREFDHVG